MASTIPRTDFPPVRCCLFDMDGLLLNTEDLYTIATNTMLARYDRPPLPWSNKAQLQGRPFASASQIFQQWAQLPVPSAVYRAEIAKLQADMFPGAKPLPGTEKLLHDLYAAEGVEIALATSSHAATFVMKTSHLGEYFSVFEQQRRILGDDDRIAPGRGKPAPDIYLLALKMVNETLKTGQAPIRPEECLVFEDSVPGVESGRRAGMRVIWCPHPELKELFDGKEAEILAGRMDGGSHVDAVGGEHAKIDKKGEIGDGWGQYLPTLENFPYEKYGIHVSSGTGERL